MFSGYPGAGQPPQGGQGGPQAPEYDGYGNATGQGINWGGAPYPAGPAGLGNISSTQGNTGYPSMNQGQQSYPGGPGGYPQPQVGGYPSMGGNGQTPAGYGPLGSRNPFAPGNSASGHYPPAADSSGVSGYPSTPAKGSSPSSTFYPSAPSGPGFLNLRPGSDQQATYGHLQHAPSFNTASQACRVSQKNVTAAAGGDPHTCWTLPAHLPQAPRQDLIGPFLRFNDYDPNSGTFATSVMVVSHPRLSGTEMQVHYSQDGLASQTAPCQLLDEYMGFKFWRFDIVVAVRDTPGQVTYMVGLVGAQVPASVHTFNLPARNEPWRALSYSCNGFHEAEAEKKYGGIAYLWEDLMREHAAKRFHVMIGGGDQVYNDHVFALDTMKPWLMIDDPQERAKQPLQPEMLFQVEQFYFGHYCQHFTDPAWAAGLASIPYIFVWDDHDVFDGWGSYPEYLQNCPVFQGMFAVARRFYLLFQQHCTYHNASAISNTLGQFSYHQVRNLGNNMVVMVPDTRSERTPNVIVPETGWDLIFNELQRRLEANPCIQHILVVLTVPIVYPKIPLAEGLMGGISSTLAQSKPMRDAMLAWQGKPEGLVSQFNEIDLLDDLRDHWTAAEHAAERQALVRRLQGLASQYSARVTFISGDVHVGAFGCFQAHPKQYNKVIDAKYMLQVVSSAIGNEPPPPGVVTALETSSVASTVMQDTLDKMLKTFNNRKLRGSRNYCQILPLSNPTQDDRTGLREPPGGLCFTLRCEKGAPGQPEGVESYYRISPLLLCNYHKAGMCPNASFYTMQQVDPSKIKVEGVMGVVAGILPGDSGAKLSEATKTFGHKLGNWLGSF